MSAITRSSLYVAIILTLAAITGCQTTHPSPLTGPFSGKVVGVSDGDTITVLVDRREVKVRLAGIDAPEHGQPYGQKAKQALSSLVFGKTVRVEVAKGSDRYGRILGNVYKGAFPLCAS